MAATVEERDARGGDEHVPEANDAELGGVDAEPGGVESQSGIDDSESGTHDAGSRTRDSGQGTDQAYSSRSSRIVPWTLRIGAFLCLPIGFGGAYATDESPVGADSIHSLVFFAGAVCGIASIYVGLYLQRTAGR